MPQVHAQDAADAPPPANWQNAALIEHHGPANDPRDPDRQNHDTGNPPSYEATSNATDARAHLGPQGSRRTGPGRSRVGRRDALFGLRRERVVVDHELGGVPLGRQREAHHRVDPGVPRLGMGAAEAPRLDHALAGHQLDLPALDAAAEQREYLTLPVAELRGCPVAAANFAPSVSTA